MAAAKAADDAKAGADKVIADAEAAAKTITEMAAQAKAAADAVPGNKFLADAKAAGEKASAEATAKSPPQRGQGRGRESRRRSRRPKLRRRPMRWPPRLKQPPMRDAARKQTETAFTAADQALGRIEYGRQARGRCRARCQIDAAAGEETLKQSQAEFENQQASSDGQRAADPRHCLLARQCAAGHRRRRSPGTLVERRQRRGIRNLRRDTPRRFCPSRSPATGA